MSAAFVPVVGEVPRPPVGGIAGRPPGGFVYPYWLPPVEMPAAPSSREMETIPQSPPAFAAAANLATECLTSAPSSTRSVYNGSTVDECISARLIRGKSLRDCEIKYSDLENCTIVDCLLINCQVSQGTIKDAELRATKLFGVKVDDIKATDKSTFTNCKVKEADAFRCQFRDCKVESSEVKGCEAVATWFRDATIADIKSDPKCKFSMCGGDVPKKEGSGSDSDE